MFLVRDIFLNCKKDERYREDLAFLRLMMEIVISDCVEVSKVQYRPGIMRTLYNVFGARQGIAQTYGSLNPPTDSDGETAAEYFSLAKHSLRDFIPSLFIEATEIPTSEIL